MGLYYLTNIIVHFLAPNMTAHIQPMDAGIINSLKTNIKNYIATMINKKCTDESNKWKRVSLMKQKGSQTNVVADALSKIPINYHDWIGDPGKFWLTKRYQVNREPWLNNLRK